jgi:hypothetical protein
MKRAAAVVTAARFITHRLIPNPRFRFEIIASIALLHFFNRLSLFSLVVMFYRRHSRFLPSV